MSETPQIKKAKQVLWKSIYEKNISNTDIILKNKFPPNAKLTYLDLTGLHFAASTGNIAIIGLFLKYGADINSKDIHGRTPLHFAASNGHADVVKGFLEMKDIEVNPLSIGDQTPLHKAIQFSRANCVLILLEKGADPFIRNKLDQNAFLLATVYNNRDVQHVLDKYCQKHKITREKAFGTEAQQSKSEE